MTKFIVKERRLASLSKLIEEYEAAHGTITSEELALQERKDRRAALVVRGSTYIRKHHMRWFRAR